MKKIALYGAALALTAGSAFAADLPSYKAPPPPPPPPPPLWTGFYVGLNAGYTWSGSNSTNVWSFPLLPPNGVTESLALLGSGSVNSGNTGGFIGGGQIGYNWQVMNSFVTGVEADIQGIAGSGGGNNGFTTAGVVVAVPVVSTLTANKQLDYLGTVRGRLGWLFTPTLLVYGTGGLAYGGVNTNLSIFQAGLTNGYLGLGATSFSDTRVGWTAGGGLEWLFMPNWSAKVEYLYYDLGSVTQSAVITGNVPPAIGVFAATQSTTRFNGNIVRAGVNYHFNWGAPAPVYAKY